MVAALVALWSAASAGAQDEHPVPREPGRAAEAPPPRPQQFRIGYRLNLSHPGHIDRENIAALAMASMDTVHLALQDEADDPFYLRIPKWGLAFGIDTAVRYVAHEYGHLSTFSKAGYRTALFGDKDTLLTTAPRASFGKMFLDGFNPWSNSAVSVSQSDWDQIVAEFGNDPVKLRRFRIAIKAGGLNQENVILDRYAERLLDGELSYLDAMPFVVSGAAVLRYPTDMDMSDTGDYVAELRAAGYRTSDEQIKLLSAMTLLSGTSMAAFRGFYLGLTTARGGRIEPFGLSLAPGVDVFAPDLENYLSQYGPTLKPSLTVRVSEWKIRPSYEQLFVGGASMGEAGLSVRSPLWSFVALSGSAFRNSDGGSWLEGGVEILPLRWLSLGLGYAWAKGYSFHRDVYGASNDILERRERSLMVGLSAFHDF